MIFIRLDFDSYAKQLNAADKFARETHERMLSEGYTWGGPGALCDCYWKTEPKKVPPPPEPTTVEKGGFPRWRE